MLVWVYGTGELQETELLGWVFSVKSKYFQHRYFRSDKNVVG